MENLDGLYAAGFRMMAPTRFTEAEICGSASRQRNGGLTELGRRRCALGPYDRLDS